MVHSHPWGLPGFYRGVRMASRLEVHLAEWFDLHGIEWAYEPQTFDLGDGTKYLPDFWLPRIGAWVEGKGKLLAWSRIKIGRFARMLQSQGQILLLAEFPAGSAFSLVRPVAEQRGPVYGCELDPYELAMFLCASCGRWFFVDSSQLLIPSDAGPCPGCGAHSKDGSHVAATHPNGGRHRILGTDGGCASCGAIEGVLVRRDWGRW